MNHNVAIVISIKSCWGVVDNCSKFFTKNFKKKTLKNNIFFQNYLLLLKNDGVTRMNLLVEHLRLSHRTIELIGFRYFI
jgi:hypothetical protein